MYSWSCESVDQSEPPINGRKMVKSGRSGYLVNNDDREQNVEFEQSLDLILISTVSFEVILCHIKKDIYTLFMERYRKCQSDNHSSDSVTHLQMYVYVCALYYTAIKRLSSLVNPFVMGYFNAQM